MLKDLFLILMNAKGNEQSTLDDDKSNQHLLMIRAINTC